MSSSSSSHSWGSSAADSTNKLPQQVERFEVPVAGGTLTVGRWGTEGPVVLAAHGITATHMSWAVVARHLGAGASLVAPDLRGRGASASLPGPYGMAAHADDLVAVLDYLAVEQAVVAGHSMGGFVAAVMATRHPGRVKRVVLIDGGIALQVPEGLDIDTVLQAIIGPAMDRLSMTFPSQEAYRDFWRAHPAFADPGAWNPDAEAYVDYDLVGTEPELRSGVSKDAVRADAADTLIEGGSKDAVREVKVPMTFLWAPRGIMNQTPGLYSPEAVATIQAEMPDLAVEQVPDVNHYSIALSEHGAAVVAKAILEAVQAP